MPGLPTNSSLIMNGYGLMTDLYSNHTPKTGALIIQVSGPHIL